MGRDPAQFEKFYRRHVEAVDRFVARRVDDPHTGADLTAEVLPAVIESAHTYRPAAGSEVGWLDGVARNVVAAERRRVPESAARRARRGTRGRAARSPLPARCRPRRCAVVTRPWPSAPEGCRRCRAGCGTSRGRGSRRWVVLPAPSRTWAPGPRRAVHRRRAAVRGVAASPGRGGSGW
ncbi:RNA polymerase sigma factor [Spirillospora sp. CA-108201]